jgi:hypothetical protein
MRSFYVHKGRRTTYICPERHVARDEFQVDSKVIGFVVDHITLDDLPPAARPDLSNELRVAQEIREEQAALARAVGEGRLTLEFAAIASEGLGRRLEAVEAKLAQPSEPDILSDLRAVRPSLAAFLELPADVRWQVIDKYFSVVIQPGRKGRPKGWQPGQPYADMETVEVTRK